MYKAPSQKIPLKKAIAYVLLSVFVIWGSLFLAWLVHKSVVQKRQLDPRYTVVALVQSCPQKESLPNWQLVEMLSLSRDKPQNLYLFDPKLAEQKLLSCPVINKATIRRLPPGIVHVDYAVKEPCALLSDFSNVALDRDRTCFPLRPYFSPKKLPELFLGVEQVSYNSPLETPEALMAFRMLAFLEKTLPTTVRLARIDTEKAFAKSAGLQEVVVVLEDGPKMRYVRLEPRSYEQALTKYLDAKPTFDEINPASITQTIDLRSPNLALVK